MICKTQMSDYHLTVYGMFHDTDRTNRRKIWRRKRAIYRAKLLAIALAKMASIVLFAAVYVWGMMAALLLS